MSWNYRIIRYVDGSHALHEVYYADNEIPRAMSEKPTSFGVNADETVSDLVWMLEKALKDASIRPVIPIEDILRQESTDRAEG